MKTVPPKDSPRQKNQRRAVFFVTGPPLNRVITHHNTKKKTVQAMIPKIKQEFFSITPCSVQKLFNAFFL